MTIVIGGGFYGAMLAETLAKQGERVTLLEQDAKLMQRASRINQARVHQGYHYPRALLTARRSRVNYVAFMQDFAAAVDDTVDSYYAIARINSKVTAQQFRLFCQRIEAPLEPASPGVRHWFQNDWIEDVFRVREALFHPDRLREVMEQRLQKAGVAVWLNSQAVRLVPRNPGWVVERATGPSCEADRVYLCGYSSINSLLLKSGLPVIPMNQEWTEMAVVEVPEALRHAAITVMCGPFFSLLPCPAKPGLHTLSHVRYTPHAAWSERDHGGAGLTCIFGDKIDNVYDMQQELTRVPR